jgi:hypothetical protein
MTGLLVMALASLSLLTLPNTVRADSTLVIKGTGPFEMKDLFSGDITLFDQTATAELSGIDPAAMPTLYDFGFNHNYFFDNVAQMGLISLGGQTLVDGPIGVSASAFQAASPSDQTMNT